MRIGATSPIAVQDVSAQRTPASMADVRTALTQALQAKTGRTPSKNTVDVLAAQVSLETAGGSQMFNFNFGGIKGASPRGQSATYLTHEVIGGQDQVMKQGFRAYNSLTEGASDYVGVLSSRFPNALSQAMSGSVDGFAHALKGAGYYTASETDYAAGLRAAVGQTTGAASDSLQPVPSSFSTSSELSRVLDAVSSSAMRIAAPESDE